jgi:hypothetical protein
MVAYLRLLDDPTDQSAKLRLSQLFGPKRKSRKTSDTSPIPDDKLQQLHDAVENVSPPSSCLLVRSPASKSSTVSELISRITSIVRNLWQVSVSLIPSQLDRLLRRHYQTPLSARGSR